MFSSPARVIVVFFLSLTACFLFPASISANHLPEQRQEGITIELNPFQVIPDGFKRFMSSFQSETKSPSKVLSAADSINDKPVKISHISLELTELFKDIKKNYVQFAEPQTNRVVTTDMQGVIKIVDMIATYSYVVFDLPAFYIHGSNEGLGSSSALTGLDVDGTSFNFQSSGSRVVPVTRAGYILAPTDLSTTRSALIK